MSHELCSYRHAKWIGGLGCGACPLIAGPDAFTESVGANCHDVIRWSCVELRQHSSPYPTTASSRQAFSDCIAAHKMQETLIIDQLSRTDNLLPSLLHPELLQLHAQQIFHISLAATRFASESAVRCSAFNRNQLESSESSIHGLHSICIGT